MSNMSTKLGKYKNLPASVLNANSTSRPGSATEGFGDAIATLTQAIQRVNEFTNEINTIHESGIEISALKAALKGKEEEIKTKEKIIQEKEQEVQNLLDRYGERSKKWHKAEEQHERNLASLKERHHETLTKSTQAAKKEAEDARKTAQRAEAKEHTKEAMLQEARAKLETFNQTLQNFKCNLKTLEERIGFRSEEHLSVPVPWLRYR
jgi:DNA repair exonuclease SbcCD ATPase subunit